MNSEFIEELQRLGLSNAVQVDDLDTVDAENWTGLLSGLNLFSWNSDKTKYFHVQLKDQPFQGDLNWI